MHGNTTQRQIFNQTQLHCKNKVKIFSKCFPKWGVIATSRTSTKSFELDRQVADLKHVMHICQLTPLALSSIGDLFDPASHNNKTQCCSMELNKGDNKKLSNKPFLLTIFNFRRNLLLSKFQWFSTRIQIYLGFPIKFSVYGWISMGKC